MSITGDDESVRHLVALGYVHPDEVEERRAAHRRQHQSELRRAMDLDAQQGRADDAAALLESLIRDDPDWTVPHHLLAEIHYRAGRWDAAQGQLEWLMHHGVDLPRMALLAGGIALAQRRLQAALDELQYAAAVEPSLPSVFTLLGTALVRLRRFYEAEEAFQQAIKRNPADARACDGVAGVCLRRDDYEGAADWALRAIEQEMRLAAAHYHLGMALMRMDRPNEALAALESCVRLDSTRAAPYYWMSRIAKIQLGDAARASGYRQRGREIIRQRACSRSASS